MWAPVTNKGILISRTCLYNTVKVLSHGTRQLSQNRENLDTAKIRNIGIMAHIDAGKTTTTERMLFFSGYTRVLGDVDDGDTIMDYMPEERERGITITSAAITFNWLQHRINLIDTPGHVDFTMEVERTLRVLDGAVAILDAAAGVEAQTLTVWRQADRYNVPRIVYLNKMDKAKANVNMCLNMIEQKLETRPLLMHLPILDKQSKFIGVCDLLSLNKYEWFIEDDPSGRVLKRTRLTGNSNLEMYEVISKRRRELVEQIADLDDRLAEQLIASEDPDRLTAEDLENAVRRITLSHKAVPVFCGSSYKNVGVQPLLDGVIKYLPSPSDINYEFLDYYKGGLCSLAFKIVHNQQKGRLTFIRIYSGSLKRGQHIYNVSRECGEKIVKLYSVYADEFEEAEEVTAGNIAVVAGLNNVITGDTLVGSHKEASEARKLKSKNESTDRAVLAGVEVPQPVFLCSIEPASLSQQSPLENALQMIQLEDPSVRITTDQETGQTILSGMGELHIEIIKHRLEKEFKVDADLGALHVAYHETIQEKLELKYQHEKTLGNVKNRVLIHLSMEPHDDPEFRGLRVASTREAKENISHLKTEYLEAVTQGVKGRLSHGPLVGYPLTNVAVWIHWCEVGGGTSLAMISAAAALCVSKMLASASANYLMEPIMKLEILTNERYLHSVLADLSPRRVEIQEIVARSNWKTVSALVPLSELLNYSTSLRVITSGTASFTMEFYSYKIMSSYNQQKVVDRLSGIGS
ncbi:hypothetical protein CHUAL_004041 [Chamberlinius hualienensis]